MPRALLASLLLLSLSGAVSHAQTGSPASASQQYPAPVVRVRPRPQTTPSQTATPHTSIPDTAPPDAAPLVSRPARPRPVNPQSLDPLTGIAAPPHHTVQAPSSRSNAPTGAQPGTQPGAQVGAQSGTQPGTQPSPRTTTHPAGASPSSTVPKLSTLSPSTRTPKPEAPAAQTGGATPALPKLSTTSLNRTVVVLDPAHGGTDVGSRIGNKILEKDVTLALAFRLRSLLLARGFVVDLTRDNDTGLAPAASAGATPAPLTLDDRAGIANHAHAAACLLLHATGRGNGVHLYTSELQPTAGELSPAPWLTAQAPWIPASQQLERSLSAALGRSHLSLISSTASVRPMDSLTCPSIILELAPEHADAASILDTSYQDRVAAALASALVFWQNQVEAPPKLGAAPSATHLVHHRTVPAATTREAQP